MKKIVVINGANLSMLGNREPQKYGTKKLEQINLRLKGIATEMNASIEFFQSDCEGAIVTKLNQCFSAVDAVIINAGAYTHYSYAIADALNMLSCIKVEVHLTNVFAREPFRATSVIAPACTASVCGMGEYSYVSALGFIKEQFFG